MKTQKPKVVKLNKFLHEDKQSEKDYLVMKIAGLMEPNSLARDFKEFFSIDPKSFRDKKFRRVFKTVQKGLGKLYVVAVNIKIKEKPKESVGNNPFALLDLWNSIPGEITQKEWYTACKVQFGKISRKDCNNFFAQRVRDQVIVAKNKEKIIKGYTKRRKKPIYE